MNVCAIIERETCQQVTPDTLLDQIAADSLEFLQLILTLGNESGCEIPDAEVVKFQTVGDMAAYLERHR